MDDVPRPATPHGMSSRTREWLEWFGLARLVTSAIAVLIVALGAWWLVRTPVPPTEASLPVSSTGAAPDATLPTPPTSSPPPSPGETQSGAVIVHVAGAVVLPGVYELAANARVDAAVLAAGGALPTADLDALNLAAPLTDGSRVYVPEQGEVTPSVMDAATPNEAAAPGRVDVNTASTEQLDALPGVGPATASAIVTERERNGPFVSADDLDRVPGIGPAKVAALSELVTT